MPIATATLSKLCARSITVDGELDVERGELVGELGREAEIGDDLLFHDVDDEARPFLEFRPVALHDVGDAELDQRVDRDVDRHPQVDAELREIEAGLERLRQRPFGERVRPDSDAAGHEGAGHQHTELRVTGAGEGLGADQLLLAQRRIDLVGAAIGDEGAIEFELGKRQFLEPSQRGIAAAEIVCVGDLDE